MFSRIACLLFFFCALEFASLWLPPKAYGAESVSSPSQEVEVVDHLYQAIDRGLLDEFRENGVASIAGTVTGTMIGISWAGLKELAKSGFAAGGSNLFFIDFTVGAFLTGAAMGTMAVVSRTYLKTPFDWASRPLTWAFFKYAQVRDRIIHEEAPAALDRRYSEFLDPVAERLTSITARFFDIPDHYWTITPMDRGTPNAFATSGYNIAVYHSIFPLAKNQAGMACVLGHEMGHVLAKHIGQQLSDLVFMKVLAISSVPFINSIYQNHETQADEIGIYLTALAGYDPSECAKVWERMSVFGGDRREIINLFISRHPTNASRVQALRDLDDRLQEYYNSRHEQLGLGIEFVL